MLSRVWTYAAYPSTLTLTPEAPVPVLSRLVTQQTLYWFVRPPVEA
jgi:hypothetical protein